MDLIDPKDIAQLAKLNDKRGGQITAKMLMQVLRLNKINKIYDQFKDKKSLEFVDAILDELDIKFEISEAEMLKIPQTGPFITVSNHSMGGIDGLLLIKLLSQRRSDFKILVNFLLQRIEPLKDHFLAVNPFEQFKDRYSSLAALKAAMTHLETSPLSVFPAGEVSTSERLSRTITDKEWNTAAVKFIKKAKVPVIPIYFHGSNSRIFHILGKIHPLLRTAKLPSEVFNKKNQTIKIRIGTPITVKEQANFTDIDQYGRYLRARTYALGGTMTDVRRFFSSTNVSFRLKKPEDIIAPVNKDLLISDINKAKENYHLFDSGEYSVVCVPTTEIPNLMTEIGRLREITFREVGEGTNKSIDIDEFDLYFSQLVVWDNTKQQVAGAYRVGNGKEIIEKFGIKGFYLRSLFKINPKLTPILAQSFELGRSFIVKEYQKRPFSLFLLWKGILYYLLRNPDFRYLIGPVSISNDFSKVSKSLLVEFVQSKYYDTEMAKLITPKKRFKLPKKYNFDNDIILEKAEGDFGKFDKLLSEIEPGFTTPVLVKKYIKLNAKIIGFNTDPKFNDCLDGLILLDIFEIPMNVIESLSKELDDNSILERFNFK